MTYVIIGMICFIVFVIFRTFVTKEMNIGALAISGIGFIIASSIIVYVDYKSQTDDVEVWSGKIVSVKHTEEYDEFIPPRTETYTETDSKGKTVTKTRVIAGYWEHHYATNYIETTDKGLIKVRKVPDGRRLDDDFVNSTEELEEFYPVGSPTASIHTYENKLKASYSIFKHKDIDLEEYSGLPEYPSEVTSRYSVNRLIGNFKDSDKLNLHLDNINTKLNDTNNPNNKEKVKSYKQVNLMFVNLGNKPEDYGWALQDHWKNGAKNDFVVTFGTDKNGKITWGHPFSWTDVEILKTDVREYMIGKNVKDFKPVIDGVADLVEKKFDRKQFAEFDYIQIDISPSGRNLIFVAVAIACIAYYLLDKENF